MIVDKIGRRFRTLRLSLTSACNYACSYCVPDGKRLASARSELDATGFDRALSLLIQAAGISRLRITGGEPLIAPSFDEFICTATRHGLDDIAITTNGQFLESKIPVLLEAGIKRITVSLDTLNPLQFVNIARGGDLAAVLRGIDAAINAGLKVKINTVLARRMNDDQILPLLDYALNKNIELRFIELMRMGHLSRDQAWATKLVTMPDILATVGTRYSYERTEAPFDSTAVRYMIPRRGVFGIIANESMPFCHSCTRLRLTSDGYIHGCLSSASRHSIADLLPLPNYLALPRLQTVLQNALHDKQPAFFAGGETVMKIIGG